MLLFLAHYLLRERLETPRCRICKWCYGQKVYNECQIRKNTTSDFRRGSKGRPLISLACYYFFVRFWVHQISSNSSPRQLSVFQVYRSNAIIYTCFCLFVCFAVYFRPRSIHRDIMNPGTLS